MTLVDPQVTDYKIDPADANLGPGLILQGFSECCMLTQPSHAREPSQTPDRMYLSSPTTNTHHAS
jgi:hypothetical protein